MGQSEIASASGSISERGELEHAFTADENAIGIEVPPNFAAEEMMAKIRLSWAGLVDSLREKLPPSDFDARQIAAMAVKLSDRRRSGNISRDEADFIGTLHSQFRRFVRLQSTKDEWLTEDVFKAFMKGIEKAMLTLNTASG